LASVREVIQLLIGFNVQSAARAPVDVDLIWNQWDDGMGKLVSMAIVQSDEVLKEFTVFR
tara:strand:- start:238 stop:417 length:180 start_codon:yes stop_codon:yes gene_type:complete